MATPWAESYSRFTELTEPATGFERHVIDLLLISQNRSGVGRLTGLSWDEVDLPAGRQVTLCNAQLNAAWRDATATKLFTSEWMKKVS